MIEKILRSYEGSDLHAFYWTITRSWGYIELMISIGDGKEIRTVNLKFLVVPYKNVYNCILGRPFVAMVGVVASPFHLKLKYHNLQGELLTINADLKGEKSKLSGSPERPRRRHGFGY